MKRNKEFSSLYGEMNNDNECLTNYECIKRLYENDIKNLELLDAGIDCIMKRIYILEIFVIISLIFNVILFIIK